MANLPVTRYHGRLNTNPARKEWRRVGRGSLVVTGGTTTPGTPFAASMSASPNPASAGSTVTLTASASGGTAPYVYTFTQTAGTTATLAGTGNVRTFTATTAAGGRTFRVSVRDDEGLVQEASVTVTTSGAVVGQPLYAGHIPNRVLIGVAGPENDVPSFAQGLELIKSASQAQLGYRGVGSYERRRFTGTQTNGTQANELRAMLADGDQYGCYNWVSFKVIGNDWAGVAAGKYPAIPQMFRLVALERKAAGKAPFMATLHHEPRTDGPANLSEPEGLALWANMQIYMSNQLADVRDCLAWSAVGNGFLWNTVNGTTSGRAERDAMFPQTLIDTFRRNSHVVAVDTYDDHGPYTGQETLPLSGQSNRCSAKLANWIAWMRARNCGPLGIGEWSVTDAVEMPKVWQVLRANRDILGIANYFNSIAGGSTWDWRLVPDGYPPNASNPGIDYGGTALTAARLNYFPTILAESTMPAYTSPL